MRRPRFYMTDLYTLPPTFAHPTLSLIYSSLPQKTVFIYSKIPELLDTIFMVLRNKKNIPFLHWFHHATVLMYCWHAFHTSIAPGIWFASMNYCVHSIMYMYFFLASAGFYRLVSTFAPLITFLQITQMIVGMVRSIEGDRKGRGVVVGMRCYVWRGCAYRCVLRHLTCPPPHSPVLPM